MEPAAPGALLLVGRGTLALLPFHAAQASRGLLKSGLKRSLAAPGAPGRVAFVSSRRAPRENPPAARQSCSLLCPLRAPLPTPHARAAQVLVEAQQRRRALRALRAGDPHPAPAPAPDADAPLDGHRAPPDQQEQQQQQEDEAAGGAGPEVVVLTDSDDEAAPSVAGAGGKVRTQGQGGGAAAEGAGGAARAAGGGEEEEKGVAVAEVPVLDEAAAAECAAAGRAPVLVVSREMHSCSQLEGVLRRGGRAVMQVRGSGGLGTSAGSVRPFAPPACCCVHCCVRTARARCCAVAWPLCPSPQAAYEAYLMRTEAARQAAMGGGASRAAGRGASARGGRCERAPAVVLSTAARQGAASSNHPQTGRAIQGSAHAVAPACRAYRGGRHRGGQNQLHSFTTAAAAQLGGVVGLTAAEATALQHEAQRLSASTASGGVAAPLPASAGATSSADATALSARGRGGSGGAAGRAQGGELSPARSGGARQKRQRTVAAAFDVPRPAGGSAGSDGGASRGAAAAAGGAEEPGAPSSRGPAHALLEDVHFSALDTHAAEGDLWRLQPGTVVLYEPDLAFLRQVGAPFPAVCVGICICLDAPAGREVFLRDAAGDPA